jgi:hypothetical protein
MAGEYKETQVLFEEIQNRTSKPVSDFFKVLSLVVLAALIVQVILQKGRTNGFSYLLITLATVLIIAGMLLPSRLITQIRPDGIYVRYPPLQPSFQKFYWSAIADIYIRDYNALSEYYGWGIRFSPNGLGYIAAGHTGIQIILKNGNKILITTQRQNEVNEILKRMNAL